MIERRSGASIRRPIWPRGTGRAVRRPSLELSSFSELCWDLTMYDVAESCKGAWKFPVNAFLHFSYDVRMPASFLSEVARDAHLYQSNASVRVLLIFLVV